MDLKHIMLKEPKHKSPHNYIVITHEVLEKAKINDRNKVSG